MQVICTYIPPYQWKGVPENDREKKICSDYYVYHAGFVNIYGILLDCQQGAS